MEYGISFQDKPSCLCHGMFLFFISIGLRQSELNSYPAIHLMHPNAAASFDSITKPVCCSFNFIGLRSSSLHMSYAVLPILSTQLRSSSVISISISISPSCMSEMNQQRTIKFANLYSIYFSFPWHALPLQVIQLNICWAQTAWQVWISRYTWRSYP